MTPIEIVGGLFGLFAVGLIVLLIYKSTLTMHEDDQLFLDDASATMRAEQEQLQARMQKITPFVRILGALSGVLILVIAGMAVWQQINKTY